MRALLRLLIRLVVLALAGYGAWKLFDEYGSRAKNLSGPIETFSDRATTAARDAADGVGSAAHQAAVAVEDSAEKIARAAKDSADEAARTLGSNSGEAAKSS
jgi:hypothetical protein